MKVPFGAQRCEAEVVGTPTLGPPQAWDIYHHRCIRYYYVEDILQAATEAMMLAASHAAL